MGASLGVASQVTDAEISVEALERDPEETKPAEAPAGTPEGVEAAAEGATGAGETDAPA